MKMEMLLIGVHSCARATRGRSDSAAARSSDTARASPRAISTDDALGFFERSNDASASE